MDKLDGLIRRLHSETRDYRDRPDDPQMWYNRGYADGMIRALRCLGYAPDAGLESEGENVGADHSATPWGKAYQHGIEMGEQETNQVLGHG